MSEPIPKYCATCVIDDQFYFCGEGDTEDAAVTDFIDNGSFEDQCASWFLEEGEKVTVFVSSTIEPHASDYEPEDIEPNWTYVLDDVVDKRTVEVKYTRH